MLTKSQIKHIKSLNLKKNRKLLGQFVVEGEKNVKEFLQSDFNVVEVFATEDWYGDCTRISEKELSRISSFKNPNKVLALVDIKPVSENMKYGDFIIALDGVKDPGNMGSIIRLADWFGISDVICSPDSVDFYNPKVVSASMGSLSRVRVECRELSMLNDFKDYTKLMMVLDGENIKALPSFSKKILILGSESHGISDKVLEMNGKKITIIKSEGSQTESLNVSNSCAIALNELL